MKKLQQFNILAFKYDRLKNNGYDLRVGLLEAERNEELIALADNELLRAIRRLSGHQYNEGGEDKLSSLLVERRRLTKMANSEYNRRRIADINNQVRELLYIPEVISITTPNKSDYKIIGKNGFCVNGKHYIRLMCSAAMARTNRALFCTDEIYPRIDEVLRCGCKQTKIVPAKWNAYYSLMSSAAFQVSTPRVCVVKDYEIEMEKEIDWTVDDPHEDKIVRMKKSLGFNIWDGMGLISPSMAKKWSEEVGYDGIAESFIVRAPFMKGLVATFDFQRFGHEIAPQQKIKDIYGNEYHCDDIDIIMTESQFKLWNAYDSTEQHQEYMDKFGIKWGVTRIGAPDGKNIMTTNYQFVQVLNMDDNDITELCGPTVNWFRGISADDYHQKILYLLGKIAKNERAQDVWDRTQDNAIKALMLEPELMNDSYLTGKIVQSVRKKMKQAYIGKLLVDGSFNFVYSDPYGLVEYAFGMEPKGLLKEFEHYAAFWSEQGFENVCAMRSPLTWRAEVNKLNLKYEEKMKDWYKYISNGIIYNMWGLDRETHSSMDFDGDICATTSDNVFMRCRYDYPPVLYQSQKAEKDIIER